MNASVENNNQPVNQTGGDDKAMMKGDDSNLVEEVLAELNQDSPSEQNQSENVSMTGSEPSSMPVNAANDMMDMEPDLDIPPQMDIEYDSSELTENTWMKKMKKQLIVLVLFFIVFNPSVRQWLGNSLPRVFGTASGMMARQGQVLLLSTIVGVLFFATNLLD